jgi:hypothetical protein
LLLLDVITMTAPDAVDAPVVQPVRMEVEGTAAAATIAASVLPAAACSCLECRSSCLCIMLPAALATPAGQPGKVDTGNTRGEYACRILIKERANCSVYALVHIQQ